MCWSNKSRATAWLFSVAAATVVAAPFNSWAQSSAATGKPWFGQTNRAASSSKAGKSGGAAAPAVPPADDMPIAPAAPMVQPTGGSTGETDVQRELKRLYQDSGREMPNAPTQLQLQRPQPGQSPAAMMPQTTGLSVGQSAAPTPPPMSGNGGAPPASAPSAKSKNPVVTFFRRFVPGAKPVAHKPPTQATRPSGPNAVAQNVPSRPPQTPGYTPYGGTPPRRLPEVPAATGTAANATAATPRVTNLPPAPTPTTATATQSAVVAANTLPSADSRPVTIAAGPVLPQPLAPVVAGPVKTESFTQPTLNAATAATPVSVTAPVLTKPGLAEPEFEEPIIVDKSNFSASETKTDAAPTTVAQAPMDFPNPFPELSENEADGDKGNMDSPFGDLRLEDEPLVAATSPETAPIADANIEPQPFEIPSTGAATSPAPADQAVELPSTAVADEAPVLPPLNGPAATASAAVAKPAEPQAPATGDLALTDPALGKPTEAAAAVATTSLDKAAENDPNAAKMQKIRDRGGMKGLKGFCPVTLRDERELKDAQAEVQSQFRGQKFHFASMEAKTKFDREPSLYAPAAYGADVVVLIRDKDVAEGTLDFAAWYKGRLYLFANEGTFNTFTDDPAKYSEPAGID